MKRITAVVAGITLAASVGVAAAPAASAAPVTRSETFSSTTSLLAFPTVWVGDPCPTSFWKGVLNPYKYWLLRDYGNVCTYSTWAPVVTDGVYGKFELRKVPRKTHR